ncbi:hypothetical protein HGRIS_014757 [Hohenbuehelia grisea]|uniref:C2H2-type domain-containing protein n=1 Tax=Hohenbuehelia grisea TaxID=104357 RepID=A0ABR3IQS7_9AGAR
MHHPSYPRLATMQTVAGGPPYAGIPSSAQLTAAPGERGSASRAMYSAGYNGMLDVHPYRDSFSDGSSATGFDHSGPFNHHGRMSSVTYASSYERYDIANDPALSYATGSYTSGRGYDAATISIPASSSSSSSTSASVALDNSSGVSSFVDATTPGLEIAGPSQSSIALTRIDTRPQVQSQGLEFTAHPVLPRPCRGPEDDAHDLSQRELDTNWGNWASTTLHGHGGDSVRRHTFSMGGAYSGACATTGSAAAGGGAHFLSSINPPPNSTPDSPTGTANKGLDSSAFHPVQALPPSISPVQSPTRPSAPMAIILNHNNNRNAHGNPTRASTGVGAMRGRAVSRHLMPLSMHHPGSAIDPGVAMSVLPAYGADALAHPPSSLQPIYPHSVTINPLPQPLEGEDATLGASLEDTIHDQFDPNDDDLCDLPPTPAMIMQQMANDVPHHTQTRERRHGCGMCHKSFDRPSTLKKHMLVHTGEKAYACEICHHRFGVLSNLNRHVRKCALKPVHALHKSGTSPASGASDTATPASPSSSSSANDHAATGDKRPRAHSPQPTAGGEPAPPPTAPRSRGYRGPKKPNENPSAPAPARRKRRAPSPSRWIPHSLLAFNLTSEAHTSVPVPLPPVAPSLSSGEERNSYDENIDCEKPYHPDGWKDRLPGPGLGLGMDVGVGGVGGVRGARGGGGGLGARDVANLQLGQIAHRGGWVLGRVSRHL